jgi:FkbM family methyltransferase
MALETVSGRRLFSLALAALLALVGCGIEEGGLDSILENGEALYSQGNEELIIRHFFQDRRDGVFVDVGCYHWRDLSTTYYLEKHLGWSGIGIDALAEYREGYEKNRPGTRFFQYAVGAESGEAVTFYVAGEKGISSTSSGWIREVYRKFRPDLEPQMVEISVPAITLDDLLTEAGVEKIDFLSMDIEGAEPQALAGFDIERFRPELVCVEAGEPVREFLLAYFEEHDYERIDEYLTHDPANWYFRPRNE